MIMNLVGIRTIVLLFNKRFSITITKAVRSTCCSNPTIRNWWRNSDPEFWWLLLPSCDLRLIFSLIHNFLENHKYQRKRIPFPTKWRIVSLEMRATWDVINLAYDDDMPPAQLKMRLHTRIRRLKTLYAVPVGVGLLWAYHVFKYIKDMKSVTSGYLALIAINCVWE
jgi:hypothetical protein